MSIRDSLSENVLAGVSSVQLVGRSVWPDRLIALSLSGVCLVEEENEGRPPHPPPPPPSQLELFTLFPSRTPVPVGFELLLIFLHYLNLNLDCLYKNLKLSKSQNQSKTVRPAIVDKIKQRTPKCNIIDEGYFRQNFPKFSTVFDIFGFVRMEYLNILSTADVSRLKRISTGCPLTGK